MKKRDYYEILAVDVKATPDEIKQAYRKQAIKWHPDKNPSEDAKERFQEIGEAYAVLSDPNERSWYDHHKDQILRAAESGIDENDEKYQEILTYGFDIWPYFSRDCYKEFDDAEKGFYTVYRKVFEIIKAEEEKAKNTNPDIDDDEYYGTVGGKAAPGFGDSKLSGERVVDFYAYWENFSSFKSFAHKDLYNPNEGGYNRQVKRLIEKDNKKERQKEKKKYIDTIKELVQFVKKRDVRYQEFIKHEAIEKQRKADAHRKKEIEKKKEMEEMKKRYREEEAERYRQEYEEKKAAGLIEDEEQYAEGVYHEDWFCEICDKEFRTENQLENHKQSKAHAKKLKDLTKEMMLDDEKEAFENEIDAAEEPEEKNKDQSRKSKKKKKKNKKKNKGGDSDEDEVEAEAETLKGKNKTQAKEDNESDGVQDDDDDIDFGQFVPQKKQNKKQQKKKEEEKIAESDDAKDDDGDDDIDFAQFVPQKKQSKKQQKKKDVVQTEKVAEPEADNNEDDDDDIDLNQFVPQTKQSKKQKKKKDVVQPEKVVEPEAGKNEDDDDDIDLNQFLPQTKQSKKQKKKNAKQSEPKVTTPVEEPKEEEKVPEVKVQEEEEKAEEPASAENNLEKEEKEEEEEVESGPKGKKLGKAKLKKLKKQEKAKAENFVCNVCKTAFETRNKLFDHLKDSKHEFKAV